ncbi:MAG TPA: APC family permease [Thermoanaerobaculia bacterium]|nr:APC family permease [Thermoanaerobaculia bacterium]
MTVATEHGLARRLSWLDLALAQVLLVVGTNWFGLAAKLGGTGLLFWLAALALFHLPLAVVVIALTRACPQEGGVYRWTCRGFGPGVGFLIGWSFWVFVLVYIAAGALGVVTSFAYAFLPASALESPGLLVLGAPLVVGLVTASGLQGLGRARFFHDVASLGLLVVVLLLAARVGAALLNGGAGALRLTPPPASLETLAIFVKLAVYGLAGLEALSILAGEVRDPERDLPRSVRIAAPVNGLIYLVGTAAVVVSVAPDEIDLVNPAAQVLAAAGGWLAVLVLSLLMLRDLGQASQAFAANARLPMVAGWDHLLPPALGRLDHRGVPRNAVLLSGAVSAGLVLAAVADAGRQEAFQLLLSAAGILFALTYVVLFSLPLFGARRLGLCRSGWLSAASACGLALTLLFLAMSVFPLVDVADPARFAAWVLGAVALVEGVGLALYFRGRRLAVKTA